MPAVKQIFILFSLLLLAPYTVADIANPDEALDTGVIDNYQLPDPHRDKTLPLKITYPIDTNKHPVIIFSHGALGSKDNYQPLVEHWASHGYVVIQPTHEDSRKQLKPWQLLNKNNIWNKWSTRPADIQRILDSLVAIEQSQPALTGKMDHARIGVGGHSFGAHTSQLLAGARLRDPGSGPWISFADPRPLAFLLISPQGTGESLVRQSWQTMTRAVMVVTGTNDDSIRTDREAAWRMEPYLFAPDGDKYLVFIKDAYHGFGGIAGKVRYRGSGPDNPDHIRYVQTTTLAFWDAYLGNDAGAVSWLVSGAAENDSGGAVTIRHK